MNVVDNMIVPARRADEDAASSVKTVRKALAILDAFAAAEMPLSVAEVAIRAGVTRPTAHRLARTRPCPSRSGTSRADRRRQAIQIRRDGAGQKWYKTVECHGSKIMGIHDLGQRGRGRPPRRPRRRA